MYLQNDVEEISEEEAIEFIFMVITYYTELLSSYTKNMNEIRQYRDIFDKIILEDNNISSICGQNFNAREEK